MGISALCFLATSVVTPIAMSAPAVELSPVEKRTNIHVPSLSRFGLQIVVDANSIATNEIAASVGGKYVTLTSPEGPRAHSSAASLTIKTDREPEHKFFIDGKRRLGFDSNTRISRPPSPHNARFLVLQSPVKEEASTGIFPGARFAPDQGYKNNSKVFSRPAATFNSSSLSMKLQLGAPNVPPMFQDGRWFIYRKPGEQDADQFHLAYVGKERDMAGYQGMYVKLRYMPLR